MFEIKNVDGIGHIYHDGVKIGTIEQTSARGRNESYVVHSRWVEDEDGNCVLNTSIAAGGGNAEIAEG